RPQRRSIAGNSISLTLAHRCACARKPPRDGVSGLGGKPARGSQDQSNSRSLEYFKAPVSYCGEWRRKLDLVSVGVEMWARGMPAGCVLGWGRTARWMSYRLRPRSDCLADLSGD